MNFNHPGYELKFIQRDACREIDRGGHLFSFVYKFFSPVTQYRYILRAEHHEYDVFAIKFYCQKDSKSDFKYAKTVNRGDLGNIMVTCLSVIPIILFRYPNASFVFAGARSYDKRSRKVENQAETQRFRIYRYIASKLIGTQTFEHYVYESASGYALINKKLGDIERVERMIVNMLRFTYPSLRDIQM